MMRKVIGGLGLLVLASAVPAKVAGQSRPAGVTPAAIEQGRQIFTTVGLCATCHGDGTGTPLAPNLTDDTWINIDGSFDAIIELINTGVPEPKEHPLPMLPKAGSGINDEQIRAVAAYVWSLSRSG